MAISKLTLRVGVGVVLCILAAQSGHSVAQSDRVDFAHDVAPILREHCVECHGGREQKGGLSLNTRALVLDAGVATPGEAAESRLIELVTSADPDDQMPPKEKPRLPLEKADVLRRWIDEGLAWEPAFTFAEPHYDPPLAPRRPELPPPLDGRTHPIDRILDAYLSKRALPRPEPLDDAAFLRRVSLDLIGRLPEAGMARQFLGTAAADRHEQLVAHMLADNQAYADHWLSFWNDLLRNAYTGTGYIDDGRRQITGWLYAALYHNKPYDQFVRELISPQEPASGFIRGIKWRGDVNVSQSREVQFAQSISQVFLGINMKCASCHDSFIDRWTLDETYGLAAIVATEPLEMHRCDKPTGRMARAAWIFPQLGNIDADAPPAQRLEQLAALMTDPNNGRLTRTIVNRLWHRLMGRGIVHPVDAMHTQPWSEDLLDYLAVYLVDHGYDLKKVLALIATSAAYQSRAAATAVEPAPGDYLFTGPLGKRMTAEQFLDAVRATIGVWPEPDARAFRRDGRGQGGQLAAVLAVRDPNDAEVQESESPSSDSKDNSRRPADSTTRARWAARPLPAALTPLDSLQASLGRPNREQIVSTRPTEFTTLEAITLANGAELADELQRGAVQLLADYQGTADELIDQLFFTALVREPTVAERETARELLGPKLSSAGLEDLLWSLFMLPEFEIIR